MATFWERATGFGDGANDLLDLDALKTVLVLRFPDLITVTRAKALLGLTTDQGVEFEPVLAAAPGDRASVCAYADHLSSVFRAARIGAPELDTIDNVMIACGFDPPPVPEL